jgi:hypothetical protein
MIMFRSFHRCEPHYCLSALIFYLGQSQLHLWVYLGQLRFQTTCNTIDHPFGLAHLLDLGQIRWNEWINVLTFVILSVS